MVGSLHDLAQMALAGGGALLQRALTKMNAAVSLAVFLLAVYGLSNAVAVLKVGRFFFGQCTCPKEQCSDSGHPKELRRTLGRIPYVGDLFYCPPCLGFWLGMAASCWFLSPAAQVGVLSWWKAMLLDGLAASAAAWLAHVTAMRMSHGLKI